jgi:hypothetical protein
MKNNKNKYCIFIQPFLCLFVFSLNS